MMDSNWYTIDVGFESIVLMAGQPPSKGGVLEVRSSDIHVLQFLMA